MRTAFLIFRHWNSKLRKRKEMFNFSLFDIKIEILAPTGSKCENTHCSAYHYKLLELYESKLYKTSSDFQPNQVLNCLDEHCFDFFIFARKISFWFGNFCRVAVKRWDNLETVELENCSVIVMQSEFKNRKPKMALCWQHDQQKRNKAAYSVFSSLPTTTTKKREYILQSLCTVMLHVLSFWRANLNCIYRFSKLGFQFSILIAAAIHYYIFEIRWKLSLYQVQVH